MGGWIGTNSKFSMKCCSTIHSSIDLSRPWYDCERSRYKQKLFQLAKLLSFKDYRESDTRDMIHGDLLVRHRQNSSQSNWIVHLSPFPADIVNRKEASTAKSFSWQRMLLWFNCQWLCVGTCVLSNLRLGCAKFCNTARWCVWNREITSTCFYSI